MKKIINLIKRARLIIINFVRKINVTCCLKLIKHLKVESMIGYNNNNSLDGTGAQIQRIIGIACLAKFLNFQFVNNGIKDLTIHPLDSFQTDREKSLYLSKVNKLFTPNNSVPDPYFDRKESFQVLTAFNLLISLVKSKIGKYRLFIELTEPFQIIDYVPRIYSLAPNLFQNFQKAQKLNTRILPEIVVHYRWGVGGEAIYHKQKISRELPLKYFLDKIDSIIDNYFYDGEYIITVLTDAPLANLKFKPKSEQNYLWINTPGFKNGELNINGANFDNILNKYGKKIKIISGGDPIAAIKVMANANFLILSRSSLSYVSALLNNEGSIFYPPDFWHPKMESWH